MRKYIFNQGETIEEDVSFYDSAEVDEKINRIKQLAEVYKVKNQKEIGFLAGINWCISMLEEKES